MEPEALTARELRGIKIRFSMGQATHADMKRLLEHIDILEEQLDSDDFLKHTVTGLELEKEGPKYAAIVNRAMSVFGTEGWRHRLGID